MPPPPPPPPKPTVTKAAEPKYGRTFDPWNSVALGHQRAETRGPQGWREDRTSRLQNQLTGGDRLSDRLGAGPEDFDGQRQVLVPKEVRARAANSVVDMLRKPGTMAQGTSSSSSSSSSSTSSGGAKIFDSLVVYVNGSTHPLISDHKLKHLLAQNGARMSIHLGRRQVTHVILGRPSGPNGGAGGGLAGGKLEKEIRRVGGCGVKYVGVEWVLESVKAGRRLPEASFTNLKVASKRQPSVYGAFSKAAS